MDFSGRNESSPLLGATGSKRSAGDVVEDVKGSTRALLREARNQWRTKSQQQQTPTSASASSSVEAGLSREDQLSNFATRVWGVLVTVIVVSMALASLGSNFHPVSGRHDATTSTGRGGAANLVQRAKMETGPKLKPTGREAPSPQIRQHGGDGVNTRVEAGMKKDSNGKAPSEAQVGNHVKPNVFFILIDDMGWGDIGYNNPGFKGFTPNLDKLAAGGIKMTNYYSMATCTPARASLMTGRYVTRYGFQYSTIDTAAPWALPTTEKIFPEYMKDAGYETHMIGKWHLGFFEDDYLPSNRGFDTFLGYLNGDETYWSHQAERDGIAYFDFGLGNATGYYDVVIDRPFLDDVGDDALADNDAGDDGDIPNPATTTSISSSVSPSGDGEFTGQYSTRLYQDRTIDILKDKTPFDEEPLYLYLAHQAVHAPLGLPPEGSFSREELALLDEIKANNDYDTELRQRFGKVLMYLDHTIGELIEYLENEGWMENSIIVVASDNGACQKAGGDNYPLRGYKNSPFEGGYKVPAFLYSTSHIPQDSWGTEYSGLMHVTDWLPTIASAAGFDLTGGAGPLDGIDHWDSLVNIDVSGYGSPRQELLYNLDPYTLWTTDDDGIKNAEYHLGQGAFRSGQYKFISNAFCTGWYTFDTGTNEEDPLTNANVCDGTPCTPCGGCTPHLYYDFLFDVEADPREENNLIEVYPEIAETLRKRWIDVATSEWTDSLYKSVDTRAYEAWAKNDYWISPWRNHVGRATEDLFRGLNAPAATMQMHGSVAHRAIQHFSR